MTAMHLPIDKQPFTIDMLRDDVRVVESRGGSLSQIKKAFSKMHRITENMPLEKNTLADVKRSRESRGML